MNFLINKIRETLKTAIASEARQSRIPLENNYWIAALRSQ
jgi:hypothetical protein